MMVIGRFVFATSRQQRATRRDVRSHPRPTSTPVRSLALSLDILLYAFGEEWNAPISSLCLVFSFFFFFFIFFFFFSIYKYIRTNEPTNPWKLWLARYWTCTQGKIVIFLFCFFFVVSSSWLFRCYCPRAAAAAATIAVVFQSAPADAAAA